MILEIWSTWYVVDGVVSRARPPHVLRPPASRPIVVARIVPAREQKMLDAKLELAQRIAQRQLDRARRRLK